MRRTKNKFSRFRKHRKHSKNNKSLKTKRRKYQKNRRTRKAGNPLAGFTRTATSNLRTATAAATAAARAAARAAAEKPNFRKFGKEAGEHIYTKTVDGLVDYYK